MDDGSKIILSYNSNEFHPQRVQIHIRVITPLGWETKGVKYFMELVNSCEEMFRDTASASDGVVSSWSSLFSKPYPDTSNINTFDELAAHATPQS